MIEANQPYSWESNIGWSCSSANNLHPGHRIELLLSSSAHPVSKTNVTLHFSVLPRLPQGILVLPLPCLG